MAVGLLTAGYGAWLVADPFGVPNVIKRYLGRRRGDSNPSGEDEELTV